MCNDVLYYAVIKATGLGCDISNTILVMIAGLVIHRLVQRDSGASPLYYLVFTVFFSPLGVRRKEFKTEFFSWRRAWPILKLYLSRDAGLLGASAKFV